MFTPRDVSHRLQNSPVPGRAWVPSSLYECGHLGNLRVTSHVFKDTMEDGQTKVVRMQLKVSAVKLFRYSCPAWNWQYLFMLFWRHDTRDVLNKEPQLAAFLEQARFSGRREESNFCKNDHVSQKMILMVWRKAVFPVSIIFLTGRRSK